MKLSNRAKRMIVHQERNRAGVALNLIPMIDILSVMVSFLLVYSTEVEVLQNTKAVEMPQSISEQQPRETVVVMVTQEELLVQGEPVAKVADIEKMKGSIIKPLKDALQRPKVTVPDVASDPAERELAVMGDKRIPYSVLKKIMMTCSEADFGRISLAVMAKETPVTTAH
jgi:biopolymer transport protein TolR